MGKVTNSAVLPCGMCGAPAVCLSVDNEPPARAVFACGDCCGCGGCANAHDAENPYCEAETGGCWRLAAIPEYVNQLRDDLNALDETTASRINELQQQLAEVREATKRDARFAERARVLVNAHLTACLDLNSCGQFAAQLNDEHVEIYNAPCRPMKG
jgi:hypothetical protein